MNHPHGAQINQESQNIEFVLGENNKYHQVGNGIFEIDTTVRKNNTINFQYDDPIQLVNNGFAFCFTEARLSTTTGSDIEHNKVCGQVSTIMKAISNKDRDLFSQFDNINENENPIPVRLADLPTQILSIPHHKTLINNHTGANKG